MSNYVSQYNFMDLLKDKGHAPLAEVNAIPFLSIFRELVEQFSSRVEWSEESHDFMDLMHDKGFVPAFRNDNYLAAKSA